MASAKKKVSWRELSNEFNICPLASGYLFSLLHVIVEHEKNLEL
jgi:hypothetical protein